MVTECFFPTVITTAMGFFLESSDQDEHIPHNAHPIFLCCLLYYMHLQMFKVLCQKANFAFTADLNILDVFFVRQTATLVIARQKGGTGFTTP